VPQLAKQHAEDLLVVPAGLGEGDDPTVGVRAVLAQRLLGDTAADVEPAAAAHVSIGLDQNGHEPLDQSRRHQVVIVAERDQLPRRRIESGVLSGADPAVLTVHDDHPLVLLREAVADRR